MSIEEKSYRGRCKYKSGRCPNERTLKYNGDIHTLCEEHRLRHNQIQCKSDTKIRFYKRQKALMSKMANYAEATPLQMEIPTFKEEPMPLYSSPLLDWSDEDAFIFTNIMGVTTKSESIVFRV